MGANGSMLLSGSKAG